MLAPKPWQNPRLLAPTIIGLLIAVLWLAAAIVLSLSQRRIIIYVQIPIALSLAGVWAYRLRGTIAHLHH